MMERMLEPELMDDPEQALVYSKADFEEENQGFVDRFREYYPDLTQGHVVAAGLAILRSGWRARHRT